MNAEDDLSPESDSEEMEVDFREGLPAAPLVVVVGSFALFPCKVKPLINTMIHLHVDMKQPKATCSVLLPDTLPQFMVSF